MKKLLDDFKKRDVAEASLLGVGGVNMSKIDDFVQLIAVQRPFPQPACNREKDANEKKDQEKEEL